MVSDEMKQRRTGRKESKVGRWSTAGKERKGQRRERERGRRREGEAERRKRKERI